MNEIESAAMWDLYAKRDQGIALQTTYAKLAACLPAKVPGRSFEPAQHPGGRTVIPPSNIYVGEVVYVYETDAMVTGNALIPYIHKRKSFEHERELRAVITEFPRTEGELEYPANRFPRRRFVVTNPLSGLQVNVSVGDLVEKVLVAPTAPAWFGELVKNVSTKYGLDSCCVDKSRLYERHMI